MFVIASGSGKIQNDISSNNIKMPLKITLQKATISLTTTFLTKEFPRNTTSILSPGEFPFLNDSRGIP